MLLALELHPVRVSLALLLCLPFIRAAAQEHPTPLSPLASTNATETSEVPEVPGISSLLPGLNAGLTITSVHDAVTGWSTLSEPAIAYSFNDLFAIDVTIPIYNYRLAASRSANPKPNERLIPLRAELGDVIIGFHGQFLPPNLLYEPTISVSAPTGDELYGLTSGRVTFDLNNHLEHDFSWVTPSLELGVGDNTTLVNQLVHKDYTSLGPLAHFQIGFAFPLPFNASFQTNAYEQLPIGDQKIYQSVTRGKTTTLIVTGHNVTEDNGFTNSLDLQLDRHATLSAYYSRSLRLHDDIVSIGITYVLRSFSRKDPEPTDQNLLQSLQNQIDKTAPAPTKTPPATPPR